jgi:hypothetical protein
MKRLVLMVFYFGAVAFSSQAQDQNKTQNRKDTRVELIQAIIGKWKLATHGSEHGAALKPQIIEFKSDGTFTNDSIYFATKEGSFRAAESQGRLILENGNVVTEWKTTLRGSVLQMELIPKPNQTKINLTLLRIKEG